LQQIVTKVMANLAKIATFVIPKGFVKQTDLRPIKLLEFFCQKHKKFLPSKILPFVICFVCQIIFFIKT
jgi:hypothetical protein